MVDPVDVLILGAGPAGTATAIRCLTRGLRVRLLERALFPRSMPGETLHPGVEPVLEHLGVWRDLRRAIAIRPTGHWVRWHNRARLNRYGGTHRDPWRGCQVMRAELDAALLQRARALGAEVSQPCRPMRVLTSGDRVTGLVTSRGAMAARIVVDATGKASWLARRLALEFQRHSPILISSYGYVEGPRRPSTRLPELVADDRGWTWTAQISATVDAWVRTTPAASRPPREWVPTPLAGRRVLSPARFVDVTWRLVTRPAGPGYFIVGDSAAVLDPARSSGVLNAMVSGTVAADCIAGTTGEEAGYAAYTRYVHASFSKDAQSMGAWYSAFPWWDAADAAESRVEHTHGLD